MIRVCWIGYEIHILTPVIILWRRIQMQDESHLPVAEQSLVFRLRKRAEIRRQIKDRKSVQEGASDRIADLLEEAAIELERLQQCQSVTN
jgi:hypothetical protein